MLNEVLSDDGHMVFIAYRAAEALVILNGHPEIELLFTDIRMPGAMNGIALAKEAKRLRPSLSILYATGFTDELLDGRNPAAHGEILSKPYRPHQVLHKIRQLAS
jgi:CheY-like chemotaxis protein